MLLGADAVTAELEVPGDAAEGGHNRSTLRAEVNRFVARSRWRVGWWEFSARLFRYFDWRCSTERGDPMWQSQQEEVIGELRFRHPQFRRRRCSGPRTDRSRTRTPLSPPLMSQSVR